MLRKLLVIMSFIAISCSKEQESLVTQENNEFYNLLEENIIDEENILENIEVTEELNIPIKNTAITECNKGVKVKFRIGAADLNHYKVTYRNYYGKIHTIIFNKNTKFSSKTVYVKVQKAESKNFQYQFNLKIVHNGKTVKNGIVKAHTRRNMCGHKSIYGDKKPSLRTATSIATVTYGYKNDSACLYYGRGIKIRFYNMAGHTKYLRYTDHKGNRKSATIHPTNEHTVTLKVHIVDGKEVIRFRKKVGLKWRDNENVVSINCLNDYSDSVNNAKAVKV